MIRLDIAAGAQHHFFDNTVAPPRKSLDTGQQFREEDQIILVYPAANRDPAVFAEDADRDGAGFARN